MARKKISEAEKISDLEAQLKRKDVAIQAARNGLFRVANISPTAMPGSPASGNGIKIVRAFKLAQEMAEKALIKMSDAEAEDA